MTAATSLITTLAQKNPDDFKTSVSLAVARLSRVGVRVTLRVARLNHKPAGTLISFLFV